MNLETFFEKFDLFADAPNAVAKMRQLILELAVQGKLVEQYGNDESAEKLLQKVHDEKVTLTNEGLLKKAERIESSCDGSHIPSHWVLAPLAALCVSVTDGDHLPPPKTDTGVPFLVISDVRWGGIDFAGCRHVSNEYYKKLDWIRKPRERDILFTLVGSFGIPVVVRDSRPFCVQRHIGILRPSKHVELHYLAYALASNVVFRQAALIATGIAQKTVPLAGLRRITIPLPPLAEQKRIVAKVDELMALCDRLEAQQRERETRHATLARASLARFADAPTPANLNFIFHKSYDIAPVGLRKTILTLAVQGKLVAQDPNDEPATAILQRIHAERSFSFLKQLESVAADELTYDMPTGWEGARLGQLVLEIQTGPFGSALHKSDYKVGGTPVINPASLRNGAIEPIDGMAVALETVKRLQVFKLAVSDIVMARRGEMGRCAVVTDRENGWLCGTGSLVLRVPKEVYSAYLAMLIGSPDSRAYLSGASVGTTMQNLNQSILEKMPVGVPPLPEQRRIVAKVEELMALVDTLETQLATGRTAAEKLMEAVVGELTAKERLLPKTRQACHLAEAPSKTRAFAPGELLQP